MANAPRWRWAVDRHGVEDDEHQDHDDGQQLADERHGVEDNEHQAAADERAEEPEPAGGVVSVHTLEDLESSSLHASDLWFCDDMQDRRFASDALVL